MFLKSEHIYFRALETSDLDVLFDIENNIQNWNVSNTITPFSKDTLKLYLQSAHQDIYTNKQLRLMICMNNTDESIGLIDLFEFDPLNQRVGVGIIIFEKYRKQGYAFEAIQLIINYTKNNLLMNQIYCNISTLNNDSIKLFTNCGFIQIGVKKQWNQVSKNNFEDELMFQKILIS